MSEHVSKLMEGMSEQEHQQIVALFEQHRFNDGEPLFSEGEPTRGLVVINEGKAMVSKQDIEGNEQTLAVLLAPTVAGELELLSSAECNATVRAKGPVVVSLLPAAAFEQLIADRSGAGVKLLRNMARALAQKLMSANELYADVMNWKR